MPAIPIAMWTRSSYWTPAQRPSLSAGVAGSPSYLTGDRRLHMPLSRKTVWIGAGLALTVVVVVLLALYGGGGGGGGGVGY